MSYLIMGAGGALMVWELAISRTERRMRPAHLTGVRSRETSTLYPRYFPASVEYFRIIDSAWDQWIDGHQPITRIVL